eukprot:m.138650 g.138650  ORF g.138650 m.138650 type:complete len:1017 (-) comp30009_c1_seq1:47-3097(-)
MAQSTASAPVLPQPVVRLPLKQEEQHKSGQPRETQCKCGSTEHLRSKHRDCPLNVHTSTTSDPTKPIGLTPAPGSSKNIQVSGLEDVLQAQTTPTNKESGLQRKLEFATPNKSPATTLPSNVPTPSAPSSSDQTITHISTKPKEKEKEKEKEREKDYKQRNRSESLLWADLSPRRSNRVKPLTERQQLALAMKQSADDALLVNVNRRNASGETPLHQVVIKGDVKMVARIIAKGSKVDTVDYAGWTPLHEACNHGFSEIAEMLIKHGARVNAQGCDNDTPLHDAAVNSHINVVRVLLKANADVNAKNRHKHCPIDVTTDADIYKLLLDNGAQPSAKPKRARPSIFTPESPTPKDVVATPTSKPAPVIPENSMYYIEPHLKPIVRPPNNAVIADASKDQHKGKDKDKVKERETDKAPKHAEGTRNQNETKKNMGLETTSQTSSANKQKSDAKADGGAGKARVKLSKTKLNTFSAAIAKSKHVIRQPQRRPTPSTNPNTLRRSESTPQVFKHKEAHNDKDKDTSATMTKHKDKHKDTSATTTKHKDTHCATHHKHNTKETDKADKKGKGEKVDTSGKHSDPTSLAKTNDTNRHGGASLTKRHVETSNVAKSASGKTVAGKSKRKVSVAGSALSAAVVKNTLITSTTAATTTSTTTTTTTITAPSPTATNADTTCVNPLVLPVSMLSPTNTVDLGSMQSTPSTSLASTPRRRRESGSTVDISPGVAITETSEAGAHNDSVIPRSNVENKFTTTPKKPVVPSLKIATIKTALDTTQTLPPAGEEHTSMFNSTITKIETKTPVGGSPSKLLSPRATKSSSSSPFASKRPRRGCTDASPFGRKHFLLDEDDKVTKRKRSNAVPTPVVAPVQSELFDKFSAIVLANPTDDLEQRLSAEEEIEYPAGVPENLKRLYSQQQRQRLELEFNHSSELERLLENFEKDLRRAIEAATRLSDEHADTTEEVEVDVDLNTRHRSIIVDASSRQACEAEALFAVQWIEWPLDCQMYVHALPKINLPLSRFE